MMLQVNRGTGEGAGLWTPVRGKWAVAASLGCDVTAPGVCLSGPLAEVHTTMGPHDPTT